MPKYLTVNQYKRQSAFPIAADPTLTDVVLAYTLLQAEAQIDAAMGFDLRLGGFEPHTGWVQQQFDEKRLRVRIPNFPVPVRRALRYQIQVSNLTTSGAGFMAVINPNDIAYNVYDFYVEIVPLQSITYSLAPVLVQLGLRPPIVQWDYEAGFYLATLGERLINSGDNQLYYAKAGFWATSYTQSLSLQPQTVPPIPPVVYKNGATVNPSLYTLDEVEGTVTFAGAGAGSDVVTLDYTATIPDAVRSATVSQMTWLLGQRALANRGMIGLDMVRLGDETLQRPRAIAQRAGVVTGPLSALCDDAVLALAPYLSIPAA